MNYTSNSASTSYVYLNIEQPRCSKCRAIADRQAYSMHWCRPCLDADNQRRAIESAKNWIGAVFFALGRESHARAYKQLALLFHPDQGGDPKLMIALNEIRDALKSEEA